MDDFTVISYPGAKDQSLLSLTEGRSRYMIPFCGRYRVVDFTIRNSISAGAKRTVVYNNCEDDLEAYVENYGPFAQQSFPAIRVVSREYSDIQFCYSIIMGSNTQYYIIYNGDNPSVIDFGGLAEKFRKSRAPAVLYTLRLAEKASMAYTILIANQKSLLKVVNRAIDEERASPNLFEMIINSMINRGIKKESIHALYWPIKSIPDYHQLNLHIVKTPHLSSLVFGDAHLKGHIRRGGDARVGRSARVEGSFVSDGCRIDGTVKNSILFPGVEVGEKTMVKDSIVLPFNRIGEGARVIRAVIDERTAMPPQEGADSTFTVGPRCYVGSEGEQLKNNDFPLSIYRSITLIGRNCEIPEGSRIGGACYVAPGRGLEYFSKTKYLYDGLSLVR